MFLFLWTRPSCSNTVMRSLSAIPSGPPSPMGLWAREGTQGWALIASKPCCWVLAGSPQDLTSSTALWL